LKKEKEEKADFEQAFGVLMDSPTPKKLPSFNNSITFTNAGKQSSIDTDDQATSNFIEDLMRQNTLNEEERKELTPLEEIAEEEEMKDDHRPGVTQPRQPESALDDYQDEALEKPASHAHKASTHIPTVSDRLDDKPLSEQVQRPV